jgi:hypothetical protein
MGQDRNTRSLAAAPAGRCSIGSSRKRHPAVRQTGNIAGTAGKFVAELYDNCRTLTDRDQEGSRRFFVSVLFESSQAAPTCGG